MLIFCTRHKLAYNDELDPACPQCTLASLEQPPDVFVDPLTLDVLFAAPAPGQPATRPVNVRSRR